MNDPLIDQTKIYDLNIKNVPIYIINLPEKKEIFNELKDSLINAGFTNINRLNAHKDKSLTKLQNIAHSHKTILSSNIKPPYIILEDDCILYNNINLISLNNEIDAIYLGISRCAYYDNTGTILNSNYKINKIIYQKTNLINLYKIYNMLSAHAILYLSKEYIKQSINVCNFYISINDHFDKGLAEIMKYNNVLALSNPLFYQTSSEKVTKFELTSLAERHYNEI
jgi:hypothetical protein